MNQFNKSVFISLPVSDLSKSIAFYKAVGLTERMLFPENTGAWLNVSDSFGVILLTHAKWKELTPRLIPDAKKTAQFGLSITTESKRAVDYVVEQGAKAGGTLDPNPVEEFDGMYGRSIEDPDGHILEFKWLNMASMA